MLIFRTIGIYLVAGVLVCTAMAQSDLPAEALQARDTLAMETARAKTQLEEARGGMPNLYITQLAALKRKYQQQGDLDGTLATIKEAKRFAAARAGDADPFEAVPELPAEALVSTPAELRQLQEAYLKSHIDRAEMLEKMIGEKVTVLITRLDTLTRDLTRQNRIEEALAVRTEAERWRRAIDDGSAVTAAEKLMEKLPANTREALTASNGQKPRDNNVFGESWRSWKYDRIASYAQEGSLFAHPDLPDELVMTYDDQVGLIKVQGVCAVAQAPVDMRERIWFGKAIRWQIPSPSQLQGTFTITSKGLATSKDSGPAVQLIVQTDRTRQQTYTQALTYRETTLRIEFSKETNSHRIVWVQGQTATPINIPADAGAIRLLLSVTVCRVGERCDSTITIQ